MAFLTFLESIRSPWLDSFMKLASLLGSEAVFLVLALYIFWCTNKRDGYYLLTAGFVGITVNQVLKILCRVPRPWVRNPSLTVVEGAMEGAEGYSFPSGHTQNITDTLGVLAVTHRQRWLRVGAVVIVLLVALSRMYLGVHTPTDVGVSLLIGVVVVLALRPVMYWADGHPGRQYLLFLGMLLIAVGYTVFTMCWPFPADTDAANLASAQKSAWTLLGAVCAMYLSCRADNRWLHFPTEAVWWAQLLKTALGLALVLAVKSGLKPVLAALLGDSPVKDAIRYFFCVLAGALLWPMSFRWFARLGKKE